MELSFVTRWHTLEGLLNAWDTSAIRRVVDELDAKDMLIEAAMNERMVIVNTDGNYGRTIYVGSVDPATKFRVAVGDLWVS